MACSIYQSNYDETYLICPGSNKYWKPARVSSLLSTSRAVLLSQFMSRINPPKIHISTFISFLTPHLSLLWKQTTYCSVTSSEQRRGLFDNALLISPELQLYLQAAQLPRLPCVMLQNPAGSAGILAVGCGQSEPRELWQPAALSGAAKKKKKALKHKSPLGREEMSKEHCNSTGTFIYAQGKFT